MVKNLHKKEKKRKKKKKKRADLFLSFFVYTQQTLYKERERKHSCTREKKDDAREHHQ